MFWCHIPSYSENLKTLTPFRVTLLKTPAENTHSQPVFLCFLSLSHTHIDSEREEDRWHISWGEAANVICYNSALISIFSNLLRDLYVLSERASILTEPWPGLNCAGVTWSMFSLASRHLRGSHGPLSSLVNFALSAPPPLAYEYPHSHTYSTAMQRGFQKVVLFKGGNLKRPEGTTKRRKQWIGSLAGCFHSCHGDELGSYD